MSWASQFTQQFYSSSVVLLSIFLLFSAGECQDPKTCHSFHTKKERTSFVPNILEHNVDNQLENAESWQRELWRFTMFHPHMTHMFLKSTSHFRVRCFIRTGIGMTAWLQIRPDARKICCFCHPSHSIPTWGLNIFRRGMLVNMYQAWIRCGEHSCILYRDHSEGT